MYKIKSLVLGFILSALCVMGGAGCNKDEGAGSVDPGFATMAYVGGNVSFEIPATWGHIAMEERQDILVFAQQENRPADGFNNVTVRVLSTAAQEQQATMDELQSAFAASFETAIKAQFPEAGGFSYSQYEENGITVFTAAFTGVSGEKSFQQTVLYPLLPQGQVVFSASSASAGETPEPESVARHMIRSLQLVDAAV